MSDESLVSADASEHHFELFPLEKRILNLTVAGFSEKERARKIAVSEPALRQHLANIFDKLSVSNEFELILLALHHQLIDSDEVAPPEA